MEYLCRISSKIRSLYPGLYASPRNLQLKFHTCKIENLYWNLGLSLTFSYICDYLWLSIRDTIYLLCENSDENYDVLAIV
jgi:hypothetical protein